MTELAARGADSASARPDQAAQDTAPETTDTAEGVSNDAGTDASTTSTTSTTQGSGTATTAGNARGAATAATSVAEGSGTAAVTSASAAAGAVAVPAQAGPPDGSAAADAASATLAVPSQAGPPDDSPLAAPADAASATVAVPAQAGPPPATSAASADVASATLAVPAQAGPLDGSVVGGAAGDAGGGRRIAVPSLRVAAALYAVALVALWLSPMGHRWNHVDILVYRQGGLAVLHGQGLYVPSFNNHQLPFTYPPISALLFTVLGPLSNYTAPLFATFCSLALLPLALRFALRLRPFSGWFSASEATRLGLAAAAAAVWFEPVWTTLRYGQVNVLIAALILFDLSRSDDRRWKGVAIGVAAGLKMTPLIFIVYLAATRRYRAAATALGGFVGTIALSFAVLPTDARIYWTQDVLDANRPGKVENAANQTLRGALSRLLHTENVQDVWLVAALLVAALGIFLAVRAYRRERDDAGGFALCALTGLLVSPISWTHHWVEAIPALMLVLLKAYRSRSTPLLVGCLAAAAIGYSQITWRVPVSNFTQTVELHENPVQLLCSNAYVIVALAALGWAAFAALRAGRAAKTPIRR